VACQHYLRNQRQQVLAHFPVAKDRWQSLMRFGEHVFRASPADDRRSLDGVSTKSYEALKTEQRQLFSRVSDEALSDWYRLRLKIRHKSPK
jgi:hypothetical protein